MQSVTFKNRGIDMAGNLYLPADFNKNGKYAAIVVVHPGGGVKEQAAGVYARLSLRRGLSPWPSTRPIRAPAAAHRTFSTCR